MLSAEKRLEALSSDDSVTYELWGVFYTNQATFSAMGGNLQAALELAKKALPLLPEGHFSSQAMVYHAIGLAEYYAGSVRPAEQAFTQAISLARQAGNRSLALDASACLAATFDMAGQHLRGLQICEEALAADEVSPHLPAASTIYIAQAGILLALSELEAALEKIKVGIELARQLKWSHVLWRGYCDLTSIQLRLGDTAGVRDALQQLELLAQRYPLPPVGSIAGDWRARTALILGDLPTAFRWADGCQPTGRPDLISEYDDLTLARIWLAQNRAREALALLECRLTHAESQGRAYIVHEIHVLRAAAYAVLGESDLALAYLSCAVNMALPEGLLRSALCSSVARREPLIEMLRQIHQSSENRQAADFAGQLLALAAMPSLHRPIHLPQGLTGTTLPEPLSVREMEVLQLIAEGLSNPEIAARLYLSVNTLRSHTTNIYQKLDVHSRMQAVTKARQIGLLSPK